MGLPGRRTATSVPTAAADTMGTAATSQAITGPPGPVWWVKPSIGTLARPIPRVNTPDTTAATCAVRRGHKLVLNGMPFRRSAAMNEPYVRTVPGTLPLSPPQAYLWLPSRPPTPAPQVSTFGLSAGRGT